MTIILPTSPLPKTATPVPIVFGGWQTPATGGAESWLGYMGSRLSMAIETPNLLPEPDGRLWTAALLDAWFTGETVACRFPHPGLRSKVGIGADGPIAVDGAGQSGMTLAIKGMAQGSSVVRRQFFHIMHGGRRYLHYATAGAVAGADGRISIPIGPMLRVQPADGDVCEFAAPMIEGKLSGNDKGWTMIAARVQGLSFTIAEIA